ncbi:MAG: 2-oxoglutarate dehydrogenase complex dihydrolipoyllysine-residue succinyltransferase [Deltaproteobacteria bacterium]|nr:2-oxoglutarate dehydrogenase complex dihydrolipoyllysine-residue succinyltransferase [Deltaproteobacteria bacterium]
MPVEIVVPPLGESISEAVIGKWNKKVGDAVKNEESLVVLETDKVTVEVPAPSAGVITDIKVKQGDSVKVGAVIAVIDAAGAAKAAAAAPAPAPVAAAPAPVAATAAASDERVTPVARRLIEEKGLDPSKIAGTGAGGKITKEDVLAYGQNGTAMRLPTPTPPAPTPTVSIPSGPRKNADREERVRMTPLRKRVAQRLVEAQSTAAILTTFNEVDMGPVMELRKKYQEKFTAKHGIKLGFMSFFIRASIEALKAFPVLNAEIEGDDVIYKRFYDIGVAVSGSRGLVVPVVRDADKLSLADLEKKVGELGTKARNDKLSLDDLQGGTFSITNGGIFGSMLSTPIINPPQTGILGMHNIVERAVVKSGQIVATPVMYVALSYDHRLVDGKEAVSFLVRIKECIEDPERILLEV